MRLSRARAARAQKPTPASDQNEKFTEQTHDFETLRKSIDDAASVGTGLWLSYLFALFYIGIAAGGVSHRDLLLENPVKLPFLGVELPLLAFFFLAPILFIVSHAYTLLHFVVLAQKVGEFEQKLPDSQEISDGLRRQLPTNIFVQFLAGPKNIREGALGLLVKTIVWSSLVIGPVLLLLLLEVQFLPYHHETITWVHRLAILTDVTLLWLLWPAVLEKRGKITWPHFWRYKSMVLLSLACVGLAFTTATFPGERMHKWTGDWPVIPPNRLTKALGQNDWTSIHNLLFNGYPDQKSRRRLSPFSTTLVLFDAFEKEPGTQKPLVLHGRDLVGAILIGTNLRKADLAEADLRGAALHATHLQDASLYKARLQNAWLDDAELQGASLDEAELQGAVLQNAKLQGASLNNANLQATSLEGAELQGASLVGARLQGASLADASFQGATLDRAYLQGAVPPQRFKDMLSQLGGAQIGRRQIGDTWLEQTQLQVPLIMGPQFQGTSLLGAQLQGAWLLGAVFKATQLTGTDLWHAELDQAAFDKILKPDLAAWDQKRAKFISKRPWDRPWTGTNYSLLEKAIVDVPEGGGRDAAMKQIEILKSKPSSQNDARFQSWSQKLERATVKPDAYDQELFLELKALICSGDSEAAYILRGLIKNGRIAATGSKVDNLVEIILGKNCPVLDLLTQSDKMALQKLAKQVQPSEGKK
jgi:uncharacterized protein YjbI with pentapeptide repeats